MAKKKFLDYDGVLYLWEKIKALVIANKVTKTSELTNDSNFLTSHQSLADYAKKTDIPAPVDISGKLDKSTFDSYWSQATTAMTQYGNDIAAIQSKIGSALTYQGSVENMSALPISPNKGDVYNIKTAGGTDTSGTAIKAGDNVAYDGSGWDVLGGTIDTSSFIESTDRITNGDIDEITK